MPSKGAGVGPWGCQCCTPGEVQVLGGGQYLFRALQKLPRYWQCEGNSGLDSELPLGKKKIKKMEKNNLEHIGCGKD